MPLIRGVSGEYSELPGRT